MSKSTVRAALAAAVLVGWSAFAPPTPSAEGEKEVCTCTCSLKRKDGTRLVISTIDGASCTPCEESCCGTLCAPILQEEMARRRAAKSVPPGDPAAAPAPAPVKATPKSDPAATPPAGSSPSSAKSPKTAAPVDKSIAALEALIKDNGASPKAVAEVRRQLEVMLAHVDPAVRDRLADKKVVIELVPSGKKIGDLDEFKAIKDRMADKTRKLGDLPGVTMTLPDGTAVSVLLENNMLAPSGYAHQDFLFFHEFAHAVQMWGVAEATVHEIERAHDVDMRRPEKSALGDYSDQNDSEHFAQAVSVYFGVGYLGEKPGDLVKKDPEMAKVVGGIFNDAGRKP